MMQVFSNQVLIAALTAWGIAQLVKVPLEYFQTHKWNWALLLTSGGMPSSHSALITATAHGIGLFYGFDTPLFALSVAVAMVVIYDATGIRRQAGKHAELINQMVFDLAQGHPTPGNQLKEVLGHTPGEAFGGLLLGLVTPTVFWLVWR